jgi:NAD(P)H-dependent flavin oxidoreductase YrpB (nitropropane dioxygenase family)
MSFPTPLTERLGVSLPIMSAGMAGVAGPELVAAVSNAGGFGTLGAIGMAPEVLRTQIRQARALLAPGRPLGVDLLLPKLGAGARATNKDYTGGQLQALVQVMIDEAVELFVCAVGVPPREVVDALHQNGTLVMNMVGSPRHVKYCIAAGVDIICAQGTEAGGHTGDISSLVLIPQVVDLCRGTGILVVGAGGISDGRGIAAAMALGASGAWIGSRFLMTTEANAPRSYKAAVQAARSGDTLRTEIYTGRPARTLRNAYAAEWEGERAEEKRRLLRQGTIPFVQDTQQGRFGASVPSPIPTSFDDVRDQGDEQFDTSKACVAIGQACGALDDVPPAAEVVNTLMKELRASLSSLPDAQQGA